MTTVAFDGKTLAADSRSSRGVMMTDGFKKLIVAGDEHWVLDGKRILAFAIAGNAASIKLIKEILVSGEVPKEPVNTVVNFTVLCVSECGECFSLETYSVSREKDSKYILLTKPAVPAVCGSGSFFAQAALGMGKSAVEAVELAMKHDRNTGGEVLTFTLEEPKKGNE